jgi:hypothetical protein
MGNQTGFSHNELNHLSVLSLLDEDDIDNLSEEAAAEILSALNQRAPSGPEIRAQAAAKLKSATNDADVDDRRGLMAEEFESEDLGIEAEHMTGASLPYIAKREVEDEIWAALDQCHVDEQRPVMLVGAHGAGKSTLWRARMANSRAFTERFDLSLTVDCFSLRSRSFQEVERDALFALAKDDEAFQSILEESKRLQAFAERLTDLESISSNSASSSQRFGKVSFDPKLLNQLGLLGTLVLARFGFFNLKRPQINCVVVFDHVECLSNASEVLVYFRKLCETLAQVGIKVLLISDANERPELVSLQSRCSVVNIGPLKPDEVAAFWRTEPFTVFRDNGLKEQSVQKLVGGSPRLLRDFCRHLEDRSSGDNKHVVRSFYRRAARAALPELSRLDHVLSSLSSRKRIFSVLQRHSSKSLFCVDGKSAEKLLMSGAVKKNGKGYAFASRPIWFGSRRFFSKAGRLWLFSSPSEKEIVKYFDRYSILPPRYILILMQELRHQKVFASISRILNGFGMRDISVWHRDPANAKLWSCSFSQKSGPKGGPVHGSGFWFGDPRYWVPKPLYAKEDPEIALAVKTGRIVSAKTGATVLPMIGESGRVSTFIVGQVDVDGYDALQVRQRNRTIWLFIQAVQPAVALAEERVHIRRADRTRRSQGYRALSKLENSCRVGNSDTQEIFQNLLRQAGCSAVVVLERGPWGWSVRYGTGIGDENERDRSVRWRQRFDPTNQTALDEIYDHPSGRGIVKTGEDLISIFQRLAVFNEVSAFLCPSVEAASDIERLIVFGSVEEAVGVKKDGKEIPTKGIAIAGEVQQNMTRLASLASAAC